MGFLFVLSIFALAIFFIMALVEFRRSRSGEINRSYQQLAKRFGGTCVAGGWFRRPRANFRYGETFVAVRPVKIKGEENVEMTLLWSDRHLSFAAGSLEAAKRIRLIHQMQLVEPLPDAFPHRFFLRANDEQAIRKLLTHGVQWQLSQLGHLRSGRPLLITLEHGRLTVQKQAALRRFEDLEEFLRLALEFYDQMQLTRTVGIEFTAADVAQPVEDALCKVCGDPIRGDLVYCRRCKTPHHHECWNYFGACSVYACGEKSFVVPDSPGPVLPEPEKAQIRKPK